METSSIIGASEGMKINKNQRRHTRKTTGSRSQHSLGFTIVELLIVIVVIGILAAIVIVAYNGVTARSKDAKRSTELASVMKALELYHVDKGGYPLCSGTGTYVVGGTLEASTLTACVTDDLVPKYIASLPTDPVNSGSRQYLYGVGFKKTGAVSYNVSQSDNYILGVKQDSVTSPTYGGWGYTDLTLLLGSNN